MTHGDSLIGINYATKKKKMIVEGSSRSVVMVNALSSYGNHGWVNVFSKLNL